jgi:hypothetical protein
MPFSEEYIRNLHKLVQYFEKDTSLHTYEAHRLHDDVIMPDETAIAAHCRYLLNVAKDALREEKFRKASNCLAFIVACDLFTGTQMRQIRKRAGFLFNEE